VPCRAARAEVHEERTVPVEHDDPPGRTRGGQAEPDGHGVPHRPLHVEGARPVAFMVGLPGQVAGGSHQQLVVERGHDGRYRAFTGEGTGGCAEWLRHDLADRAAREE